MTDEICEALGWAHEGGGDYTVPDLRPPFIRRTPEVVAIKRVDWYLSAFHITRLDLVALDAIPLVLASGPLPYLAYAYMDDCSDFWHGCCVPYLCKRLELGI